MSTPTADAFLASTSFITCANLLLVQVQGLGAEVPHNKVEGMMHLWQKWCTMQGGRIMWERDRELLEWCMVKYRDNLGAEWLAPFANNFAPVAPSFDKELEALLAEEEPLVVSTATKGKEAVIALLVEQDLQQQEEFWQEVAKEFKADAQQCIANSLKVLAREGLGLGEAKRAGKGSWQGQEEEEEKEGAKKKTPDTTAGAATGAATPAARKAPTGSAKGLASPTKKGSLTKPASKRRGRPMPRYKMPMQQDFSDKELAHLLVPSHQAEAPQDIGALHEEMEQDKGEEEAKVGPEAAPQAQPWGWGLPQWSWLPEWGANDPATWDVSSGDEPESWEPRRRVMARYDPQWTLPPAPRVTGEAFKWLGEDLAHSVVPLQLATFLERMRAWAAQMERLLVWEKEAVQVELMGLHLWYSTLRQSVEMLCNYQEDMTRALKWQEENNVQEGGLLPFRNSSLPSNDN
ncbi:hypothetical protein C0993_003876 [Termitomyces sp. T159_Od127]|nr:hypothetical protein C0993_003876 [Termitomyces sp. T159_Od127]